MTDYSKPPARSEDVNHELRLDELRDVVRMLGRIGNTIVTGSGQPANTAIEPTALTTT